MSPKRKILLRCAEKIAENHEAMDTGLEFVKYNRRVGQNEAYADILSFAEDLRDDDDEIENELEDLPT